MKALKLISHPLTVTILFLFIIISGKSIGGVYLFYLLLALPAGLIHTFFGLFGILLLNLGPVILNKYRGLRIILNIVGVMLLIFSIYFFFANDRNKYNWGSFNTVYFWVTFLLFSFSALMLVARNILDAKYGGDT